MARRQDRKRFVNTERYSNHRESWLHLGRYEFAFYVDSSHPASALWGPNFGLMIRRTNLGRPVFLSLATFTEEELLAVQKFINRAIEIALPITKHRDKVAADAYENGDDSFGRCYREPPNMVIRKRKIDQYDPGVPFRPTGTYVVGMFNPDSKHASTTDGDEVSERDPAEHSTKDIPPPPDIFEEPGEVPGTVDDI